MHQNGTTLTAREILRRGEGEHCPDLVGGFGRGQALEPGDKFPALRAAGPGSPCQVLAARRATLDAIWLTPRSRSLPTSSATLSVSVESIWFSPRVVVADEPAVG